MNKILSEYVEDLNKSLGLPDREQSVKFEIFTCYTILSKEYNRSFDVEDIMAGGGDDTGLDGVGIIVNNQLVTSIDEIDQSIAANPSLESTYIFIQSKTSSNFDSGDILKFFAGVSDFFADTPKMRRNQEITQLAEISNYLYAKANYFKRNPLCKLYYITTGTWQDDEQLLAISDIQKRNLLETGLFESVQIYMYGANEIQKVYRDSKNPLSATISFPSRATLPGLPGISEAYYGILSFQEFKKLIVDDNDSLNNVFYDNVRDFQGLANPVNNKIAETLRGADHILFTVLNNGVTIVASNLKVTGNMITLSDFQIVNGCQTSNVLFEFRNTPEVQDLYIPVKIIGTANDDIKTKITVATNSQTAIRRESLQAMTDFQKNLEEYYKTFRGEERLYYERRSKQYQADPLVEKSRIITLQNQIKSFSAMFLENPHMVTSNFGKVVKDFIEKDKDTKDKNKRKNKEKDEPEIFNPKHNYLPYYVAAYTEYKLDRLFKNNTIDAKYKKVKYFFNYAV